MGTIEFDDGAAEFRDVGTTSEGLWVGEDSGNLNSVDGPSYTAERWDPNDDYLIEKSADGEELVVYDRTEGTQAKYKLTNGSHWSYDSSHWIGPHKR